MTDRSPRRWLPSERARALRFSEPRPLPGDFRTDHAAVQIAMDADRDGGWVVLINKVLASYVDLGDPTHLEFEYLRWIADIIDALPDPVDEALRIVHLGGAACTLPVYLAVVRPSCRQVVVEYDAALVDLMRAQFGIRSSRALSIVVDDALAALQRMPDDSAHVIVRDAFGGPSTPEHLRDAAFAAEVRRVLSPGGVYLANIGDQPGLALTRDHLTHNRRAFGLTASERDSERVAFICDPSIVRGRRYGNVVVAISDRDLPIDAWRRAARSAAAPARVTYAERLWPYLAG